MLNEFQRTALHPHIQHLSPSRSRALLTGTCLSFASATRAIREGFRALISEAALPDCLATADPIPPQATPPDVGASAAALQSESTEDPELFEHSLPWDFDPLSRPREEGNFGYHYE